MKKIMLILLALIMVLSLAACGQGNPDESEKDGDKDNTPQFSPVGAYSDPEVYKTFDAGSITTQLAGGNSGGTINKVAYAGLAGKDYSDAEYYTYNDFVSATTGLNWNPHAWETNEDSYLLAYLTMGFYDFVLNENLDGYAIIPEMAADYPVDVTADYVGKFGVLEGESGKAWKIALNPNATWSDGTKITADDYIYSMQEQLNSKMLNRRADSFYAGDFVIVGAKGYLYSNSIVDQQIFDGSTEEDKYTLDQLVKGDDGVYTTPDGAIVKISTKAALDWLSGNTLDAYVENYGEYFDVNAYESLAELANAKGYVVATDDSISLIKKVITAVADWGETDADAIHYMTYEIPMPEVKWDEVGLVKVDDYTIVIVVEKPIEEPEFYVPYNLSSNWLVKKDLYEACKTYFDADGNKVSADSDNIASITTTYCTSLDTSVSYGPYDLTYFEADKQFTFERNDNWYGYSDGKHVGQFQTDKISVQVIAEHKTQLQAFLAGDVDGVGLQSDDMELYASSDRIRYTPESYTTKVTFNTNYEKLLALGNNAQILAVKEFRQAFALSLDREDFATAYTSAGEAGFGLLNYMYCYNPFTGGLYREDESAKAALCAVYGVTYGEGGDFDTLDEAYDALTGYDMAAAKALMQTAYDKAVAAKIYDGKGEIKLDFRVYNSDEIYVKMFNYFDKQLQEACKGTSFEGKVSLTMTADADYYETMYSGNAAIIFSTWGGAAMSPFTMIGQVYTDAYDGSGNQMEIGYNTTKVMVKFTIDEKVIEASLKDWADWACAVTVEAITGQIGDFADYDYATRCAIFSKLEEIYLSSFATTPIYYRNSASLSSRKIETGTNEYLQIVGTGGIRYITYNYTDSEWANAKADITY